MTHQPVASRRHSLVGLFALLTGLVGGAGIRSFAEIPFAGPESLLAVLDDPAKAGGLGRAYLRGLPAFLRSSEYLAGAILAETKRGMERQTHADLRRLINERVRRDFSEGTVVAVDGWFLSLTEARLYALAALA